MPLVGVIYPGVQSDFGRLAQFRQGLAEAGYVEGQSVAVEYRWAEGRYQVMPELVADLLRRQVTVIATPGTALAARAAKDATATVPIVFSTGDDPVKLGLVASLARPGRNLTGVSFLNTELAAKRLGLVRELLPAATLVAVLVNPANISAEPTLRQVEAAAKIMRVAHPGGEGEQQRRDQCGLRKFRPRASARALRGRRRPFQHPACPTGPFGIAPCDSGDLQ
jgi:putative ABC transport system substrate-binding protein